MTNSLRTSTLEQDNLAVIEQLRSTCDSYRSERDALALENQQLKDEVKSLKEQLAAAQGKARPAAVLRPAWLDITPLPKYLWWNDRSGYGYVGRIPCELVRMSKTGKRAYVRITSPEGYKYSMFVAPEKLEPREVEAPCEPNLYRRPQT